MEGHGHRPRWLIYLLAGVLGAILIGPYLVLVLLACGLFELVRRGWLSGGSALTWKPAALTAAASLRRHRRAGLDRASRSAPSRSEGAS